MFKNYCSIAWRNMVRNRFYSLVNIIGLSAGIAFTLVIGAYVWSELQVNAQLKNASRQYIIQSKWRNPNQGLELTSMGQMAKALWQNYPDLVANYYRWDGVTSAVSKGDKSFREGIQVCDTTFFRMYGFTLLHGDVRTAFNGPYAVIITTDKARKYFGTTDVLGQTLGIADFSGARHDFVITGVLNKPYRNSVTFLTADNDNQLYISAENIGFFGRNMNWANQHIASYIELQPGVRPQQLEAPMRHLLQLNAPADVTANMKPYLVLLKDYYLAADNGLVKKMLYALSAIAGFILLMAVINFINLAVSRSATRMREIGIRKVLGGIRRQLMLQFLIESVLLVLMATLLAVLLYVLARPLFAQVLGKPLPALGALPVYFFSYPLLLAIGVGLLAGMYPAFVLSSLKSVDSLKGKLGAIKDKVLLRKSLVTFQFGTAAVVFIAAIIISQQIRLFFSKDLGYNKSFVITTQLPRNWSAAGVRHMQAIRNELAAMPEVSNISLSFETLDGNNSASPTAIYRNGADSASAVYGQLMIADEYYAATYHIPMAAGEFFSAPGAYTDSTKIVVNETQAQALGWKKPQEAVGRQVQLQGTPGVFTIAGVTKDFHAGSMQQAIPPLIFWHVQPVQVYRLFSIRFKPGNMANAIDALQKKWATLLPGAPFDYRFMDEALAAMYKAEIQLQQAAYTGAGLSLVIVLLGVVGLVALSVQKRTREIGIRKVLGSSVKAILLLFVKEFLSVVLVAGLFACPLAYLLMHHWLGNYAYRISITPLPFVGAVLALGIITALLIVLQTLRTARANPVKSLRAE